MGITWSLAIEEQFYLFFPIAVYFLSRRSVTMLALSCLVVAPLLRDLFERAFGNWYAAYVLMPSRCDALMFGVVVALIIRNQAALEVAGKLRWFLDGLALFFLYLICVDSPLLYIWDRTFPENSFPPLKQSLLAFAFAVGILRIYLYKDTLLSKFLRLPTLAWFGAISYALYMYHQAVNGLLHGIFFGAAPKIDNLPQLGVGLLVVATAIGLAALSSKYIEQPIRRYGRRLADRVSQTGPIPTVATSVPVLK
jgi:peptidoglycan/LPS O-acetylase OafA/YrhL